VGSPPPIGPFVPSDEALVAGLAAGDGGAAKLLVGRYQSRLYGLALGVLQDRTAAEDVAQEAFVRAWRHAGNYDARRGSVAGWLLRITRNLAIDALRLRRADVTDPSQLSSLDLVSSTRSVEDVAVTSDETTRVRWALSELPAEQARAVLLAAFYGRTAEEISRSEEIPLGTAKTRIRLGLRKVRAQLADALAGSEAER
jgi:RNA polymerase sigma-70 factor (ECF subfamily)